MFACDKEKSEGEVKMKVKEKKLSPAEVKKEAAKVNSVRSKSAMSMDDRKKAKVTLPASLTPEQMKKYSKNPNKMDIVGVDAPKGSKVTITKTLPKKPTKKSKRSSKTIREIEYPEQYSRELSENMAIKNTPYHEDMRARLSDDAHGEVARNSRWKYSNPDTIREYRQLMRDEAMMQYNKKPVKKKSGRSIK